MLLFVSAHRLQVSVALSHLPTLAARRVEKHVQKRADSWLRAGWELYKGKVEQKTVQVKTTGEGQDIITECQSRELGVMAKARLEKLAADLTVTLAPFRDRASRTLEIVIDVSGSMGGVPANTAFYISNLLVEALGLPYVTVFASTASRYRVFGGVWPLSSVLASCFAVLGSCAHVLVIVRVLAHSQDLVHDLLDWFISHYFHGVLLL
jgi:hypothetical protein